MFCTKCGKQLHDGDIFCANCGNKVRREEPARNESRYSDVVFNPPFKLEAEKRTAEISEGIKQYSSEPKRESVSFDWNLDGFPGSRSTKQEKDDFQFNWDDVLEKRRRDREVSVEKIIPKPEKNDVAAASETAGTSETAATSGLAAESETAAASQPEAIRETQGRSAENGRREPSARDNPEAGAAGALSIEELERELFGEAPSRVSEDAERELEMTLQYKREDIEGAKDKFYTYNAKKDAFQELLDKEKARIEKLERERKEQWETLAPTEERERQAKEPPAFEDIFIEPELLHGGGLREVGVETPPRTLAVMAEGAEEAVAAGSVLSAAASLAEGETEMQEADKDAETPRSENETEKTQPKEESAGAPPFQSGAAEDKDAGHETQSRADDGAEAGSGEEDTDKKSGDGNGGEHKEKAKLRFSDVFPREAIDADGGAGDGGDTASGEEETAGKMRLPLFTDDDEEEKKRKPVLKIVIIVLAALVAIEVAVIGIKFLAPESGFSKKVDELLNSVTGMFTGKDGGESAAAGEPAVETTYMTEYINSAKEAADNIGVISEAPSLKYDLDGAYAFEEIPETEDFQNGVWKTDEDGKETYVGMQIVTVVIDRYNAMKDEGSLADGVVGINTLEIGEIRAGEAGYYVLTKLTYANEDGGETVKYESVYLSASSEAITVKEIKEENL